MCLLVLIFVALALFCHLPVGHGSFTSVYGPHTPLREYRISLQLMHAVTTIAIISRSCLPVGSDPTGPGMDAEPALSVTDATSSIPTLRC